MVEQRTRSSNLSSSTIPPKPIEMNLDGLRNMVWVETTQGNFKIRLRPDWADNHTRQIRKLVHEGFYNGLTFHRVLDGFMAQTGCPRGDGTGTCGYLINEEFNDTDHVEGICSMARGQDPNSASSQWFIVTSHSPHLNKQYTAWGQVIEGMDVVHKLKKGNPQDNGKVEKPDRITRMYMADGNNLIGSIIR